MVYTLTTGYTPAIQKEAKGLSTMHTVHGIPM